jgi:hypothetical protein
MKKQLRECRTQDEIRNRLKTNAGLITETTKEDEDMEISGMKVADLRNLIRDILDEVLRDDEGFDDTMDEELNKILSELELEL